jgi:hypothetical protein
LQAFGELGSHPRWEGWPGTSEHIGCTKSQLRHSTYG